MRSSATSAVAQSPWPAVPAPPACSFSAIVTGEPPFDREGLEAAGHLPTAPHSIVYCSELPGDTPLARAQALLTEIRQRKARGEFSAFIPTTLCLHGTMRSGELMVGGSEDDVEIPLSVLLRTLSSELFDPFGVQPGRGPAPLVLSMCFAGEEAPHLLDFPRPVIINASKHRLFIDDAHATFRTSVQLAEHGWRTGTVLPAGLWFDHLTSVSGDVMHQTGQGEWLVHDPISSSASLASMSREQAGLTLRAKMMHGSVDDLAEALLLFGTGALEADGSLPPMHFLGCPGVAERNEKILLLAAAGVPLDQRDQWGNTLLHLLCDPGQSDAELGTSPDSRAALVRLIAANGGNPAITNHAGQTPLELAAAGGRVALLEALRQRPAPPAVGPANLRIAARAQGWDNVLSLLDDPLQVMDIDDDGDDSDADQISENSDS